ncbi:unnamed protein product [Camellia sinensis]
MDHNSDHQVARYIVSGFTGVLKGWWDNILTPHQCTEILSSTHPVINTNAVGVSGEAAAQVEEEDAVYTLINTMITHFIGHATGISDRNRELLMKLRCPSLSHFRWYKDIFLMKVMQRGDGGVDHWKAKFIDGLPTLFVERTFQKRTAPAQVVGWPPIRSFRKNLASSSSSKQIPESQNVVPDKVPSEKKRVESFPKGFFVKINMDGVPIGRKVDLKAYDSYEKLSSFVDELFRGLLAAQRNSSAGGIQNKHEGERAITDLLDGSGEYTLVYEDNEGDRMLVGDVPWHMFLSTVKRLRVLKSSELSTLRFGSKQEKIQLDAASK